MIFSQFFKKAEYRIRQIFIFLVRVYQAISGWMKRAGWIKDTCVFYPTCSAYMVLSIEKYGIFRGTFKGIRRILRCHPWQKNHFDPV